MGILYGARTVIFECNGCGLLQLPMKKEDVQAGVVNIARRISSTGWKERRIGRNIQLYCPKCHQGDYRRLFA